MPPLLLTFAIATALAADPAPAGALEVEPAAELTIIALRADAEDPVATTTLDADALREQGARGPQASARRRWVAPFTS